MVTFHVDGAEGSAVAGLRRCWVQSAAETPMIRGFELGGEANEGKDGTAYLDDWQEVTEEIPYQNGYRVGWEGFIRHIVAGEPFASDLRAGIRDVQFAEASNQAAAERIWVPLPQL